MTPKLPFSHFFQFKERYGIPALVLNPYAWPSELRMDANQAKRLGRGWHPFTYF